MYLKSSLVMHNVDGTGTTPSVSYPPATFLTQYNTDAAQAAIGATTAFVANTAAASTSATRISVDKKWFYIAEVPASTTGTTASVAGILAAPTSWGCAQLSM